MIDYASTPQAPTDKQLAPRRTTMNGKPVFRVPAKSVINFKSGFIHKKLCDGPTFSAGTACCYDCSFCYVPAAMKKQQPWLEKNGVTGKHEDVVIRRSDAVRIVREQLTGTGGRPKFGDPNDTRTIYASPLVDVAGNMELVRETADICKVILSLTHWNIRLLSKSNLLPEVAKDLDAWMAHDAKKRVVYGVSTGTLDDGLAKAFEQGTPLVSKRVASLRWLQDNGYRTFAMVCPSLPQRDTAAYEHFAAVAAAELRYDKCEHVWAEPLNARGESFGRTHKALADAGYTDEAAIFKTVSEDSGAWEMYARQTFLAHTRHCPPEKLRFLQYVTDRNRGWWQSEQARGAVLL